jgi:glycosyltransferase involved in cell wall biosynthesis
MRVAMFSSLFPPVPSGSSHMSFRLSCELARAGHEVTAFCAGFGNAPPREEVAGVRVVRLPAWRLPRLRLTHHFNWFGLTLSPGNLAAVRAEFQRRRFDVVHAHNHIFDITLLAVGAAKVYRLPLALTLHTIAQHPGRVCNAVLAALDRGLARPLIVRRADAVVSTDPQMTAYLARRFGVVGPPVIPYGIDLRGADPADGARVRARYGLGAGPVILSLGHVHPLRDRRELIQAMPAVLARRPDARLLVVGDVCIDGPRRWVAELGLGGKVIFTGAVPGDQVGAFLAAADVEAHWLTGLNALSLATMEAMSAGVPVLTTAYPEQAEDGLRSWENSVTVPPGDVAAAAAGLVRLLTEPDLRRRIGRAGKDLIRRRYSWDAVRAQHEELYERLTACRRPSAGAGARLAA